VVQAYVFPLVSWIWIGFWVLVMGTLICLIPSKVWVKARSGEEEPAEELELVER
jgi:cytochrome c-type biogenesis protein CcmF